MEPLPDLSTFGRFDERLREVAADRAAVEEAVAAARARLAEAPSAERSRLLGYVGNALRLLGRHAEAVTAQRESLAAAATSRAALAARIRLGEALRCADELSSAEAELRAAVAEADAHPLLRDFALQHLGKTLLDSGRAAAAVPVLAEALALREAKGDEALVESTRLALDRARRG